MCSTTPGGEAAPMFSCHFDFSRFGLGVTSRDLSMTLPVLQTFLCKCPLAPKLLGLEWFNLGKS